MNYGDRDIWWSVGAYGPSGTTLARAQVMDTYGYPTKATQDAVIATAKAAKDAAVAGAVQ